MSDVVDASAVLAFLREEPGADRVLAVLPTACISAVNLAEVASHLASSGLELTEIRAVLDALALEVAPFDEAQALEVAWLRPATRAAGLSLGDRACLALAARRGGRAITADRAWARLDLAVEIVTIR